MKNKEIKNGVSLFAQSEALMGNDPLEEIFALNLGDFISEHLISQDLAQKIGAGVKDKKSGLKNQLKELISLYSMNNTLSVLSFDSEHAIFNSIAHSIMQMLDMPGCRIYLFRDGKPELAGSAGSEVSGIEIPMISSVKTVGKIVIADVQPRYVELVESIASLFATSMTLQETIDEANRLIEDENSVVGDLQHIRAELTALIGDLCNYQQEFVERLASAVDAKGQYKVSHSRNTAELARKICKELELNEKTTDLIYYAGLLQNIGKIAIPEKLFAATGKLSPEELKKIQEHSDLGVHLLMNINFLSEVVPYITYQSERFDGSGKPEGLKGNSIPFGSRIIAAADAFSALTSDRPQRKAFDVDAALEIIKKETGAKWDPVVVEALYKVVK
ncbi:MAG: HD domain-containing protein [Heliobacteriaceae bacterium]|jgi:HD-GYP domain-containing protein (c-di-GMP phosphodiesterase class II)|nr:HD domain-containing protein [Heliobacteriaceae bacterium]